jgi:hypothetical protein
MVESPADELQYCRSRKKTRKRRFELRNLLILLCVKSRSLTFYEGIKFEDGQTEDNSSASPTSYEYRWSRPLLSLNLACVGFTGLCTSYAVVGVAGRETASRFS